jgi:hypothetical protein
MGSRRETDRERLEGRTSVPARGGSKAVSNLKPTEGAPGGAMRAGTALEPAAGRA